MRALVWTMVVLVSYGCGDDGGGNPDAAPGPDRRTATITPASGGTLTSADGRLVITFPPGAVSSEKELWVESAGTPGSYNLGPEGETFAAPGVAVGTLPRSEVETPAGIPAMHLVSESAAHGREVLVAAADVAGKPLPEPAAYSFVDKDSVRVAGDVHHFSSMKIETAGGTLVFIYTTTANDVQKVGDQWTTTVAVRNDTANAALVARVDSSVGCPGSPTAVVPRGDSCPGESSSCCEQLTGTDIHPAGGVISVGAALTVQPPLAYRCASPGLGGTVINVVLRVDDPNFASVYAHGSAQTVTCAALTCGNQILEPGEQCDGSVPGSAPTCTQIGYDGGTPVCTNGCIIDYTPCYECGDDTREGPEECEGLDLAGQTCMTRGFAGGTLVCSGTCTFDTSGCVSCGNGMIEAPEQCDGTNLNGQTCATVNSMFAGGTLACTAQCAFNTSGCYRCGDGVRNGSEECDASDFGGDTCQSLGFYTGTLGCFANCTRSVAQCSDCGNGVRDVLLGEACDGNDLAGATCQSAGFDGGTMHCSSLCELDTRSCTDCGDGDVDPPEACDGFNLQGNTCATVVGPNYVGTLSCKSDCSFDGSQCTLCGNAMIDAGEQCDGANLNGKTCLTQGFTGGVLACNPSCQLNTSGCTLMTTCGNGIVEPGETCDDNNKNTGDGCGFTCQTEGGYTCTGQPSTCLLTCGNGVLDPGEGCEDGFREAYDGCSTSCQPEAGFTCVGAGQGSCTTTCGDGVPRGPEFCDDGNANPNDACNNSCQLTGAILETEPNDDGTPGQFTNDFSAANANGPIDVAGATDTVYAAKLVAPNGNSGDDDTFAVRNLGTNAKMIRVDTYSPETGLGNPCTGSATDTKIFIRNNLGTVQAQNLDRSGTDRCSGLFVSIPAATTFYIHVQQSTDSDLVPAYLLRVQSAACGNGSVGIGEECEPPGTATCDTACQRVPMCSDGFVDGTEQCDDNNLTNGDGCTSSCTWETVAEQEPNDDGSTAPMSNDFSSTNANGPTVATRIYAASIIPAGDDDVYSIGNPTLAPITVRADIWMPSQGVGTPCGFAIDTKIVVRDAAGTALQTNDDRGGLSDKCSGADIPLAPGETKYVHVTDASDTTGINSYWLRLVFP